MEDVDVKQKLHIYTPINTCLHVGMNMKILFLEFIQEETD